ncbi:hypothetical protein AAFX19_23375 [Vibrio harveyi]|uniref:hypothetical protein n=1 Tax=Vibrio harveyi TaxID=669 RepID=UPI0038CD2137
MINIEREIIQYQSIESGRYMQHHILIANTSGKQVLLSLPNLFLSEHAISSIQTSNRYSTIISRFYRYLSTIDKFQGVDVGHYHVIADNQDVKKWQVYRQVERVRKQSDRPTSATIFEDAKVLMVFFKWIKDSGYVTNVSVKTTWVANFKSDHMLNYVMSKGKQRIDTKNITVLDKESRQRKSRSLISKSEIKLLIESYNDPVYSAMFKLALGTAMRPMELCCFPLYGSGRNKHIMPFSSMAKGSDSTVDYTITSSKGNKSRNIKIHKEDLRALEDHYIRQHYYARAEKYEARYKRKCPPSILFLTERGDPVVPSKISSRTNATKRLIRERDSSFRESVQFYDTRHWWPTMFLIKFFGDRLLTEAADVLYAAAEEALTNQMGHSDVRTTYKFYVDKARVLAMSNNGYTAEIINEDGENVMGFIERFKLSS